MCVFSKSFMIRQLVYTIRGSNHATKKSTQAYLQYISYVGHLTLRFQRKSVKQYKNCLYIYLFSSNLTVHLVVILNCSIIVGNHKPGDSYQVGFITIHSL